MQAVCLVVQGLTPLEAGLAPVGDWLEDSVFRPGERPGPPHCPLISLCSLSSSSGLIGFLFMLRALVAANFNTIYIYTAEVSAGLGECLSHAK